MWITPSGEQKPPASAYVEKITRRPEDYRVLERMPLDKESIPVRFENAGEPVKSIAILDTETTGLGDADVIELGIVRCGVDSSNCLSSIDEIFDEFNDPGHEIPPEITELTGISDDMVKGKRLNESKVSHILRDDPVIVVHNAGYDRPLFEKVFPSDDHRWVCSMEYYDWYKKGFAAKKLERLLELEGFFFEAHRAYMDCLAVAFMLRRVPESLSAILKPRVKITAVGSPFRVKDVLKERGYQWDGKTWSTILVNEMDEYEAYREVLDYEEILHYGHANVYEEMAFLKELYPEGHGAASREIDQRKEFKTSR